VRGMMRHRCSNQICVLFGLGSTAMSHPPRILKSMAYAFDYRPICTLCDDNLEHCHGVAIIVDEIVVCSDDPNCEVSGDLHHFVTFEE
jgi:hypothetical protein